MATTAEVHDNYAAMDVFALTSREDPFPLVMLEAGGHGLPTVCFAGAGGAEEFAGPAPGGGGADPPGAGVARGVGAPAAAAPRSPARGEGAARRVERRHRVEVQAPLVLQSIEQCLAPDEPVAARMAWR